MDDLFLQLIHLSLCYNEMYSALFSTFYCLTRLQATAVKSTKHANTHLSTTNSSLYLETVLYILC